MANFTGVPLQRLLEDFETRWPKAGAEEWDRPGLILGNRLQQVSKVLLSVDASSVVIAEASDIGAQLLVSHHPMFLRGVFELAEDTARGLAVASTVRAQLAIFSAHTNADHVPGGVSEGLALALGLRNLEALDVESGHGRVGSLDSPLSLLEFARRVGARLPATASGVRVMGDADAQVSRVALLAGAGDSFLPAARDSGADVFITSDLRHHPAQEFLEGTRALGSGPALIDISHWAAEWVWLDAVAENLRVAFPAVEFVVSDLRTDPWDFAVMQ